MKGGGLGDDHIVLTSHETPFSRFGWKLLGCLIQCCFPYLACIFLVGFSGCIIIPTHEHALLEGRGDIDESDIAFLEVNKTPREDVLLRFGEPDLVLHDQRTLIYHWSVSHGYWLVGYGYSGAVGPIPKDYLFMLEFDGEGILKRFELGGSIWTTAQYRIDKWTPPASDKLTRENIFIDPIPTICARTGTPKSESRSSRFQIGEFRDGRGGPYTDNFIGQKKAVYDVIIADVRTLRPVTEIVRAAVGRQLQGMGHQLVEKDADVVVLGKVEAFSVTTAVNILSWNAIGSLDVILEVQDVTGTNKKIIRRYKARHVSETYLGPSDVDFEQVMRECLEDIYKQMASDVKLNISLEKFSLK
jgi:hypothetical protein